MCWQPTVVAQGPAVGPAHVAFIRRSPQGPLSSRHAMLDTLKAVAPRPAVHWLHACDVAGGGRPEGPPLARRVFGCVLALRLAFGVAFGCVRRCAFCVAVGGGLPEGRWRAAGFARLVKKNAHRCSPVKKAPCPAAAMPAPEERRYNGVFWHARKNGWVVVTTFKKRPLRSTFFASQGAAARWLAKRTGQPVASLKKIKKTKMKPKHRWIYWHRGGWEVYRDQNARRRPSSQQPSLGEPFVGRYGSLMGSRVEG